MLTCCVSCTMLSWHTPVKIAEYIGAADQVLYMYPISPSIVFTGVYFNAVKVYLV